MRHHSVSLNQEKVRAKKLLVCMCIQFEMRNSDAELEMMSQRTTVVSVECGQLFNLNETIECDVANISFVTVGNSAGDSES